MSMLFLEPFDQPTSTSHDSLAPCLNLHKYSIFFYQTQGAGLRNWSDSRGSLRTLQLWMSCETLTFQNKHLLQRDIHEKKMSFRAAGFKNIFILNSPTSWNTAGLDIVCKYTVLVPANLCYLKLTVPLKPVLKDQCVGYRGIYLQK